MSGINYLKKLDKAQLFRLYVDGRYHKKYQGWVGYEAQESGSTKGMVDGFCFMMDNFDKGQNLSCSYIQEIHKKCLSAVDASSPNSTAGDIRYLENGMSFFADNTSFKHIQEVLDIRKGDNTFVFHPTSAYGKFKKAEELDAKEIYNQMQKHRKLVYRCWYPNLDQETKNAIYNADNLYDFYNAKHYVQMLFVKKFEELVAKYNQSITNVNNKDDKLKTIALLIRELELLHPYPDGNCRVFACVLLNHLLMYHDFPPSLLFNPNLDGLLSLEQWIEEIEIGMEKTLELIENPNLRLYDYSISEMPLEDKKKFLEISNDFADRIDNYNELYITSENIKECSKGQWINLKNEKLIFSSIGVKGTYAKNAIYFAVTLDDWSKRGLDVVSELNKLTDLGVSAIVMDDPIIAQKLNIPVFIVDDALGTLENCAKYVRDELNPFTLLVTGTEGKTGTKIQLHHLLKSQTSVHAILNSSNATVPILRTLADIKSSNSSEIVEFSVDANQDKTIHNAKIVNPNLCFFSNIGTEHMHNHKSIEGVIKNKAAVVEGLRDGGICIVNSLMDTYPKFLEELKSKNKKMDILTFGESASDNGVLIEKEFDVKTLSWKIKARIENEMVEYSIPMIQSHAPLMSVGVLLAVKVMGYDIQEASKSYKNIKLYESMGQLIKVPMLKDSFYIYDQSRRASIEGVRSAFKDISNLKTSGKVVALIGSVSSVKENEWTKQYHQELAELINKSSIDVLYTTGANMQYVHDNLDKNIQYEYIEDITNFDQQLLRMLQKDDIFFIQGYMRLNLDKVVKNILVRNKNSQFLSNIKKMRLKDLDTQRYRDLMILKSVSNDENSSQITQKYFVDNQYIDSLVSKNSYRTIRRDILKGFFDNLNSFLLTKYNIKNINDSLAGLDFNKYVYTNELCDLWFGTIDNTQKIDVKFFGSYYDFGDGEYFLNVLLGLRNLHIGLGKFVSTDNSIQITPLSDDDYSKVMKKYGSKLINEKDFVQRMWEHRPVTLDCGRVIDLSKVDVFKSLVDFSESRLVNKIDSFVKLLKNEVKS